ncbi:MAG: hypothetical protein FWE20_11625 [Defluviitaleaceae bacterium]|nr:hypothetical protein [Defluviitaleaceae bacterium]
MPLPALVFYLQSKHEYAYVRDVYVTDMLLYTARGFVKEPDKLPRYRELVAAKNTGRKAARRAPHMEYSEQEIIDLFRGKLSSFRA